MTKETFMTIGVLASDASYAELTQLNQDIDWKRISQLQAATTGIDGFFDLTEDAWEHISDAPAGIPIFINCVCHTLQEKQTPPQVVRINGWPGFIHRPVWEIAGTLTESHLKVLAGLGIKATPTPDEPGFIAARILSMIINEAYFAKEDQVSSESDIDIAMKLGTNYPKGPFEWSRMIGLSNILFLLDKLAKTDPRYTPAALLRKEANNA